ncbi:MAG: adenylate/guanylate cyclase domain-containing protein [Georgfuchsia sp.]
MAMSNRTLVASILFLDIVEYSKQSVTHQLALKQRLNSLLADALKNMALGHRIMLDTGDGAAISFQVNPEDSMFVALHLRDAIAASHATNATPKLQLRFGINLGPVRLINDLNGKVNIVGDGINVAQRMMDFAKPGSIMVSRSYYEVVSHLTDDFAKLFRFAGTRTDKHKREYAVYEISKTGNGLHDNLTFSAEPQSALDSAADDAAQRKEERGKVEAEDQTRRMAELNAELEEWEHTQREKKEKAKRDAAEKARLEAEETLRRQEVERLKREAEDKAQAEIEEKDRVKAEEKALAEAEERRKRETEERRRRETVSKTKLAALEQVQHKVEEKTHLESGSLPLRVAAHAATSMHPVNWGKRIIQGLLLLVMIAIGTLHLLSLPSKVSDIERGATEQFGQPVKIEAVHLLLFPPQWQLDGVTIGADSQIRAARINAIIDPGSLFGEVKRYKSLDIESLSIKPEALGWVLFGTPNAKTMRIISLHARRVKLDSNTIDLPLFDAKADISPNGTWQKLTLEYVNKSAFVELRPGNGQHQFEVNANKFTTPFGSEFAFNGFTAKGSIGPGAINMSEFEGGIFGGTLIGNATLKWSGVWTLGGKVTAKGLNGSNALPTLLDAGHVDGNANFTMLSPDARRLFENASMDGKFSVTEGVLSSVNLEQLLHSGSDNGKINFFELAGSFNYGRGNTQLRQVRVKTRAFNATGSADADATGRLHGSFTASDTFSNKHSNISLSGNLNAPHFSH